MKAKYVLTSFKLGDVEDPEIYSAEPIWRWQQTPDGKWCMDHAEDVRYNIAPDDFSYGYKVTITGILEDKYATYYALKQS